MHKIKLDTILLLLGCLYLGITTFQAQIFWAFWTEVSILLAVLVWEAISLIKTKQFVSDHIKKSNKKVKPIIALGVLAVSLIIHFLSQ